VPTFRTAPLDRLVIPDGIHVEEHDLVTEGDVIIGSNSAVGFGVRSANVIAGERVEFGGHIEAEGDCRLDTWCEVADDVLVGEDAYLGERVQIDGALRVAGDLDIGEDVDIADGFDANGRIIIRDPMPTIVFLFMYLTQLLRIGEDEAAEQLVASIVDEDHASPVLIPKGSRVSDDAWRVSTPGEIGNDCRIHGNIRAESLVVGRDNEIFGSLRAREGITVGADTEVTGNVTTREGTVRVGPGTVVRGDVSGEFVEVHREAAVKGAIRASEEMSMVSEPVLDDTDLERDDGLDVAAADQEAATTGAEATEHSTEESAATEQSAGGPDATEHSAGSTETDPAGREESPPADAEPPN
jgi:predicted acyltransferase (DUF342 family)